MFGTLRCSKVVFFCQAQLESCKSRVEINPVTIIIEINIRIFSPTIPYKGVNAYTIYTLPREILLFIQRQIQHMPKCAWIKEKLNRVDQVLYHYFVWLTSKENYIYFFWWIVQCCWINYKILYFASHETFKIKHIYHVLKTSFGWHRKHNVLDFVIEKEK